MRILSGVLQKTFRVPEGVVTKLNWETLYSNKNLDADLCIQVPTFTLDILFIYLFSQFARVSASSKEISIIKSSKKKLRALSSQPNILTERPPLVGEVSANFRG
jgi:hypothetical protein